jgi:hypothetical protein
MAGWYKQHTSELASLEAFAQCGRVDLVIAWLRITRWTVDHESDDLPATFAEDASKLDAVGLRPTFAARCKKLLDQREAMAAKRELKKHHVNSSELTSVHVSSSDHQDKTIQDKTILEKKKRAPRVPKPSEDGWAPKQDHIDIAKERGLDLNTEVTAMLDWLKASGKTYKDYDAFARNWLRRANPRPAQVKRPNLSNNLLQTNDHPEGAGEEYWLAGINKYGGNHG